MSSTCSKTCGTGKQLQTRTITTHEENGGSACSGENIQEIDCNADACPTGNCIATKNYYGSFCYIIFSPTSCSPLSFHNSLLDPCTGVTCGTGLTATSTLGVCQCLCGTSLCDLSISNTCDNGICKCGGGTSCDSTSTIPSCLTSSSATPGWGDSTATCKVNFVNNFLRMVKTF